MGNNMVHCVMISGIVLPAKRKELEQTFRFAFNQLMPGCLQYSLSADIFIPNLYHFFSLWPTAESLDSFCSSQEFQVLEGAYRALGSLEKEAIGEFIDLKSFPLTDLNK